MAQLDHLLIADLLRRALAGGQQPWLTITSNSMLPLLARGDQIQLAACSAETLPPGEIIVVVAADALLAHRYWRSVTQGGQTCLITRGDRPLSPDPPWPAAACLGRVVARRRGTRTLALTSGPGRRLNAHLAGLAHFEEATFTSVYPAGARRWAYWPTRLSRALLLRWGYFSVAVVEFISARQKDSHVKHQS